MQGNIDLLEKEGFCKTPRNISSFRFYAVKDNKTPFQEEKQPVNIRNYI